jgi:hypothetical protein
MRVLDGLKVGPVSDLTPVDEILPVIRSKTVLTFCGEELIVSRGLNTLAGLCF